jgi:peptidoglycan-associated lipoprotein
MRMNRCSNWASRGALGLLFGATLLAGCGGKKTAVIEDAPPPPPPPPPPVVKETPPPPPKPEVMRLDLQRVHFDFDKYDLTPSAQRALAQHADALLKHPEFFVLIEGHCDERGTVEYNLALGEKRAEAARDFLVNYGVSPDRIRTISYGKSRPLVAGVDEATWAQNRRDEFKTNK